MERERVDTDEIKARIRLEALIEKDLGPPARASGEWSMWHCPFHNDQHPSLGVRDGSFYCFGCQASGDHFSWLEAYHHMTFLEAVDRLVEQVGVLPVPRNGAARKADVRDEDGPPGDDWQVRGRELVAYAQEQLWTESGAPGRAYLRAGGLTDATVRRFGLGWLDAPPRGWYEPPDKWGLTGRKKIWLPQGVVIPGTVNGDLWYIKIRRFTRGGEPADGEPKYPQPRGARTALFAADGMRADGRPLLLCEGERDAMLAWQELGDVVDVATLGGASKGIPDHWASRLRSYSLILAAYDADEAGAKGAARQAASLRPVYRVHVPRGGDLTGFYQSGGDLRAWLSFHLDQARGTDLARSEAENLPGSDSIRFERLHQLETQLEDLLEQIRTCDDAAREAVLAAELRSKLDQHQRLWVALNER